MKWRYDRVNKKHYSKDEIFDSWIVQKIVNTYKLYRYTTGSVGYFKKLKDAKKIAEMISNLEC